MKRRALPSLNALKAFEAVCRHQSFSVAADELCVTHSAISHQIKVLETWLNKKLFIRHASTISLTPEADGLFLVCHRLFNELEACIFELKQKTVLTEISIGASHSFMANWLIPRLEQLELLHPHIHIQLMTCNDFKLLEKDKVDIFIHSMAEDQLPPPAIKRYPLFPDKMGPICHSEIEVVTTPYELLNHALLHTYSNKKAWTTWFKHTNIDFVNKPNDRYFDRLNLMIEAAVSGLGIAIAPEILIEKEILNGRVIAPFGFTYCGYNFYALTKKNREHADIITLIDWLMAQQPD